MRSIAVVVPLYNGEAWIEATLDSVIQQSLQPSEIIVIDNNSTDRSSHLAARFPNVTLLHNPIPGGGASRQMGIAASQAEVIACLNQDDIWHPDHLLNLADLLDRHPDCSAAIASCIVFSQDSSLKFPALDRSSFRYEPWKIFPGNPIQTPSSVMIRRSMLDEVGGWPAHVSFGSDHHAWLRLGGRAPMIQSRSVTVGYRRHRASVTRSALAHKTEKSIRTIQTLIADYEAALEFYLNSGRCDREWETALSQRMASLKSIAALAIAVIELDWLEVKAAILDFEASVSFQTDDDFVSSISGLMIWLLYGYLSDRRGSLSHLLAVWPAAATRTGSVFRRHIAASRIFPHRLLREPLSFDLWHLLWEQLGAIYAKLPLYRC